MGMVGVGTTRLLAAALVVFTAALCGSEPVELQELLARAEGLQEWLVDTRRHFHMHPELLFQEHNTSRRIRALLDEWEVPYRCSEAPRQGGAPAPPPPQPPGAARAQVPGGQDRGGGHHWQRRPDRGPAG